MQRGTHRKATYEDRFYRHWCCGKRNHNSGWSKDKHRNRKKFRRYVKEETKNEIIQNENQED